MAMTLHMADGEAIGILAVASSGIAAIGGLTGRPQARSGVSPVAPCAPRPRIGQAGTRVRGASQTRIGLKPKRQLSLVFARTGVTTQVRSMLRCYSNSSIDRYVV